MKLRLRPDGQAFREDARKLGLVLLGAGIVGIIIDSDKVTALEGLALFGLGAVIWLAVILLRSTSG
jgi:hypothetical protein